MINGRKGHGRMISGIRGIGRTINGRAEIGQLINGLRTNGRMRMTGGAGVPRASLGRTTTREVKVQAVTPIRVIVTLNETRNRTGVAAVIKTTKAGV